MLNKKELQNVFVEVCKFVDDCQYRIPELYKIQPMTEFIKKHSGNNLIGVEIGVFRGINAYSMLDHLSIEKLYLIDPYKKYPDYNEPWLKEYNVSYDENYKIAIKNLTSFKNKIKFILEMSDVASKQFKDNTLDFVFIDGNHKEKYVSQDIALWYPKIKIGSVLGGHNYEALYPGTTRAVNSFIDETGLHFYGKKNNWWIVK